MRRIGSHRRDTPDETTEVVSPWTVPGLVEPAVEAGEQLHVAAEPAEQQEFPVHAPAPRGGAHPRATWQCPNTRARFVWVSAHGGAGSTSLATSTGEGVDLTGAWPDPRMGWPTEVVLVARSNAAGLDAAARLLAEAASGQVADLRVAALLIGADAQGKPSKNIRARIHELSGTVPLVVQLPWVEGWREAPYTPDRAATAAAAKVAALITR